MLEGGIKESAKGCPSITHPAIILVSPQMGENIGAAARVMMNFGMHELRIVAPRDGWPNPKAEDMAAVAAGIVRQAKIYETLREAIADLHCIFAVTARPRDMVKRCIAPRELREAMGCHPERSEGSHAAGDPSAAPQDDRKYGLIFGRERIGLTNEEVALADVILTIPTDENCASLNLAQAVAVVCYEASGYREEAGARKRWFNEKEPDSVIQSMVEPPATKEEIIAMLEHLERELEEGGFYAQVPNKKPKMTANLRNLFSRAGMTAQEVQSMRGVIRALAGKKRR